METIKSEYVEPKKLKIEFSNEEKSCGSLNETQIPTYEVNEVTFEEEDREENEIEEEGNTSKNDSLLMNYLTQQQSQYYQQIQQTQQMLNHNLKEDNDDLQFFKSLLPTVQTLNLDQKLSFRIEVMKLLAKFLEDSKT